MVSRMVISLSALAALPYEVIVDALSTHFAHDWDTKSRSTSEPHDFAVKEGKQISFHRSSQSGFYVVSVRSSLVPTILLAYEVS